MSYQHYENISDEKLEEVIRDVVEKRCKSCGIDPRELLGTLFNIPWIKQWVRAGMPVDKRDQDFKYEVLMEDCRIELDEKLSS